MRFLGSTKGRRLGHRMRQSHGEERMNKISTSRGGSKAVVHSMIAEQRQIRCYRAAARTNFAFQAWQYQRAPKCPPNEDPPRSGLRVSVRSFSSLRPMKQLFGCQRPLAKTSAFSIRMSSGLLKRLLLMVASVVKTPIMMRVTLLCGRALSGWALRLLLTILIE